MARSALIVMFVSALSALLGFILQIFLARYYGTRPEMDAFLNASTIPIILFGVINGALVSALVPTFSDYVSLGRLDEVRRLGSTVINTLFFVMSGLAVLGWLCAPVFVPVMAHGFPPAERELVVRMVRWLMPGVVALSLSGVCTALLNANHRFLASALVTVAANLVTTIVVVALHRELGIFALVLGSVFGLFAQLLVQLPSILRHRLYNFEIDFRHPGLLKAWALLLPVAVGSGAGQVNIAFDRYFASTLSAGSTAAIGYTTKLAYLPIQIVAAAIGTVIFPLIASNFASSNKPEIRHSVSMALRMVSFIVIPCAAGLSELAYPIVQTLFERGAFNASATALCASYIPFACLPLLATSYNSVLGRACFACKEVRMAVTGSVTAVLINVALSATLLPILGGRGLLLANGVGGAFLVAYLVLLLSRLVDGFDWSTILSSFFRVILASLVMVSVLYLVLSLGVHPGHTLALRASYLLGLLAVALVVFLGAARALRIKELAIVATMLRRKLPRVAVSPAAIDGTQ